MLKYAEWKLPAGGDQYASYMTGQPIPTTYIDKERKARDDAALAGFKEGLSGALKGDGLRGLARGFLGQAPELIDYAADSPFRAAAISWMLGGKVATGITGNDAIENSVRNVRDTIIQLYNSPIHNATKSIGRLANSKALDPKYLSPMAYKGAVDAGRGAAWASDLALYRGPVMGILGNMELADVITRMASEAQKNHKALINMRKTLGSRDATLDIFAKRHKAQNGPVVAWSPEIKSFADQPSSIFDIAGMETLKKDPTVREMIKQRNIQTLRYQIDADRARVRQMRQAAGAGVAGAAGLIAAHQITKRIPILQKKRILRSIINILAATGAGYAGWKLLQK